MEPTILFAVMSPAAVAIVAISMLSLYHSGTKQVNDYEKLLREMRMQLVKGNLCHEKFCYMKENLKVEEVFAEEARRLDLIFSEGLLDKFTYTRMKTILQQTFNEKLVKIHTRYYD